MSSSLVWHGLSPHVNSTQVSRACCQLGPWPSLSSCPDIDSSAVKGTTFGMVGSWLPPESWPQLPPKQLGPLTFSRPEDNGDQSDDLTQACLAETFP